LFNPQYVDKELSTYRAKGPDKTTRILAEAIKSAGVRGLTLLDIGGGVGAVQQELLGAGVTRATNVEASSAYLAAAKTEAQRQGTADRVSYHHGNFVDLAPGIEPADIVTLDRVICCYPQMNQLVGLSVVKARRLYGLVYPRDTWWVRLGLAIQNVLFRIMHSPFRAFVHPTKSVEALLHKNGFRRNFHQRTFVWQVAVFTRE
jgi:magnesium-protoporphyrin O-methyltransferase